MPNVRTIKTSFGAGEISPELFGRLDLAKEQEGLANCHNMWILPHGPAQNRPGFQYVYDTKKDGLASQLIPFNFSNDQSFVLEVGHQYIRFHTKGATVKNNLINNGELLTDVTGWSDLFARYSWSAGRLKLDGQDYSFIAGTFDSGLTGWTQSSTGTGSSVKFDAANKSAALTKATGGTAVLKKTFNITNVGTTEHYVLDFVVAGTKGVTCQVKLTAANGIVYHDAPHKPGYNQVVFTNSGTSPVTLQFSGTAGAGIVYIDSVELRDTWSYVQTDNSPTTAGETYSVTVVMAKPASLSIYDFSTGAILSDYPLNAGTTTVSFVAVGSQSLIRIGSPQSQDYINYIYSASMVSVGDFFTPYELKTDYDYHHIPALKFAQSGDILTLVHPSYPPRELKRYSNTLWTLTDIAFGSQVAEPTGITATAHLDSFSSINTFYKYKVTAVNRLGYEESLGSAASNSVGNALTVAGTYNTITWTASTGDIIRYNVYKFASGTWSYIGQTPDLTFKDDNITADLTRTIALSDPVFNGAGKYPSAVGYHQQRRWFAATTSQPQNVWGTQSGTETNMSFTIPSQDSDAIRFKLASQRANQIRHIVPLADMVLMTASTEYRISESSGNAITPSTISIKPQSQFGANLVTPVIVNNAAIYSQAQGNHLREMTYQWQSNGYQTKDLSVLATHLFHNDSIVDMAFARTPQQIIWAVTGSGKLLGLTYLPDQEVAAWHQHSTDGWFENVCVVTEGIKDVLYAIVRRTINGEDQRYVEMLTDRSLATLSQAFFVDCGLTYSGAAATVISGLDHLEGKLVSILADGVVQPQQTVGGGHITLTTAASLVTVGLPIDAYIETPPTLLSGDASLGQGHVKNINKVWARCTEFVGAQAGPSMTKLATIKPLRYESNGTTPMMTNGEVKLTVLSNWNPDGTVIIRQPDPLPLTIVDLTLEVAVGG